MKEKCSKKLTFFLHLYDVVRLVHYQTQDEHIEQDSSEDEEHIVESEVTAQPQQQGREDD